MTVNPIQQADGLFAKREVERDRQITQRIAEGTGRNRRLNPSKNSNANVSQLGTQFCRKGENYTFL